MSEPIETVEIDGYTVEILQDDMAENPFELYGDVAPSLVLHDRANRHFGWGNDDVWAVRLSDALEKVHATTLSRALAVIDRWMRVFHGVRVVLPVAALDHSDVVAYLGDGAHWCDPGGWDSGWVGWLFYTPEAIEDTWMCGGEPHPPTDEELDTSLRAHFTEFAAWVEGDVYGYRILDPGGEDIGGCWGFYGPDLNDRDGWLWQEILSEIEEDKAARAADEQEVAEAAAAETGEAVPCPA